MIESDSSRSSAEEVCEAQDRCNQILECKNQILYWKSKLEALEEEQTNCIKVARLRLDAASTWRVLSRQDRSEKRFILAALESPHLPKALLDFPSSPSFPSHIRLDREVLLARVRRPDFDHVISKIHRMDHGHSIDPDHRHSSHRETAFFLPKRLRTDKEVILAILPKYPYIIECMGPNLQNDDEILESLLIHHPGTTIPPQFLAHFSNRIRSSRRHVLDIVEKHRTHGLAALAYAAHELRNCKDFALDVISKGRHQSETQVLRYFSQRLRADPEVVHPAVCQSGLNLKYASYPLRRDKEIIRAACNQNGSAFRYCLSADALGELMSDVDFVRTIIPFSPAQVLKLCPNDHKNQSLMLEAAVHGLEWDSIPVKFREDFDFVKAVLSRAPRRYFDLRDSMKEDWHIAHAVIDSPLAGDDCWLEATEQCPGLLAEPDAMFALTRRPSTDILLETLAFSPLEIRNNKDIMVQALQLNPDLFDFCSEGLQNDFDILAAALPSALYLLSDDFQMENPDLVKIAIEKTPPEDLWMTYEDICDDLWQYLEVAKAWLRKGGEWLTEDFPDDFLCNEELWKINIEHNWSNFDHAPQSLRSNKEFVMEILTIDARIIRDISDELKHDYDIALLAFSKDARCLQFFSSADQFEFMVTFAQWVRRQLSDHSAYHSVVQTAFSAKQFFGLNENHFAMLNQGPEMVSFYSSKIASYLDLPDAKQVERLRVASRHLLGWGI